MCSIDRDVTNLFRGWPQAEPVDIFATTEQLPEFSPVAAEGEFDEANTIFVGALGCVQCFANYVQGPTRLQNSPSAVAWSHSHVSVLYGLSSITPCTLAVYGCFCMENCNMSHVIGTYPWLCCRTPSAVGHGRHHRRQHGSDAAPGCVARRGRTRGARLGARRLAARPRCAGGMGESDTPNNPTAATAPATLVVRGWVPTQQQPDRTAAACPTTNSEPHHLYQALHTLFLTQVRVKGDLNQQARGDFMIGLQIHANMI